MTNWADITRESLLRDDCWLLCEATHCEHCAARLFQPFSGVLYTVEEAPVV